MSAEKKLARARELLELAQRAPEGEQLWLLTLAWSQLQEAAEALTPMCDVETAANRHQSARALAAR